MNKLMTVVASVGLLAAIPGLSLGADAAAAANGTVDAAAGTAGAAVAADATTKAGASTDATKAGATANMAAGASLGATSTYSDVTGSLSAAGNANLDLTAVTSTSDIKIVKVSSLTGYKTGASASMREGCFCQRRCRRKCRCAGLCRKAAGHRWRGCR